MIFFPVILVLLTGCTGREIVVTGRSAYYVEDSLVMSEVLRTLSVYDLDTLGRQMIETVDVLPEPADLVEPDYPKEIVMNQKYVMDGRAYVKAFVSAEGLVTRAHLWKSSDDIFNKPSLEAAMRCRFTPGMTNGKAVSCWVIIPFKYHVITDDELKK